MKIVIVGAGLGGLVLAQALRDRADVIIVEKDAAAADTGGFRIALTPEAVQVVEDWVPTSLVGRIRAVSDGSETFSQFTIANARLHPIIVAPEPPHHDRMLCQRRALRQILTEGLEDRIQFGTTATTAHAHATGASVTLSDGSTIDADLVVAADGARSATLNSITSETSHDTGLVGIAGSTPLQTHTFPKYLTYGPALAIDKTGLGMFLSLASRGLHSVPEDLTDAVGPPSLVWGLISRRADLPNTRGATAATLARICSSQVENWNPWMRSIIEASDPARTAAFNFRAADPKAPRFPWAPSRITAVGDSVHAMPPTGGRAGSTAIRSAGALAQALTTECNVDRAIANFQQCVDDWAGPAIRESLGPVRIIQTLRSPAAQTLAGPLLCLAGAIGLATYRRRR